MTGAIRFLTAFTQSLATMTLYPDGHPARERVIDAAYQLLLDLQVGSPRLLFTFLGDEIVFGKQPLRELKGWEWGPRLAQAGVQRVEFDGATGREDFEEFLEEVLARLTLSGVSSAQARQQRRSSIRFGSVGLETEPAETPVASATLSYSLDEEARAVRWLHDSVQEQSALPIQEAEAVVRSLSLAMRANQSMVLPMLQLRDYDEYTVTHSLNVSVLGMGLAEFLGMSPADVQAIGVAGLLHDLGKVRIPRDVLTKPGKLSGEEREIMNRHPADGARMIIEAHEGLDLAAVVAYEHHIMIDGGGYPRFHFPRDCHRASKLVHVCDVYDALRTNRPYRAAWPADKIMAYLAERAGTEFDADVARAFTGLMRVREESAVPAGA